MERPTIYLRESAWLELRDAMLAAGFENRIHRRESFIDADFCRYQLKDDSKLIARIRDVMLNPGDYGGVIPPVASREDAVHLAELLYVHVPAISVYPKHQIYRCICNLCNIPWSTLDVDNGRSDGSVG